MIDYQGKKFRDFLVRKGISKVEAGKRLGISRSAVYDYFESSNLSRETVKKIITVFNTTEEEIFMIDSDQEVTKSNAIPFAGNTHNANMYVVPVKAYGGFLTGYESPVFLGGLEKSSFPFVRGECFAFEVDGLSMYKDYVPGDWVVTTPVEDLNWLSKGKVYVFQLADGIILKCFDKIENDFMYLYSLNDDYNPVKPVHLKDVKKVYFKEKVIKN